MSLLVCNQCQRALLEDAFDFRSRAKGRRQNKCRECTREYSRSHYQANKAAYVARAKKTNKTMKEQKRELVRQLKAGPCTDCGRTYPPECMEFDHREGRTITGSNSPEAIANLKNANTGVARLQAELAKCDLVCSNCHRIRTFARRRNSA